MVIFYKKWKKYNEFQLTKNKMDLNIRKMTNHPPSPDKNCEINGKNVINRGVAWGNGEPSKLLLGSVISVFTWISNNNHTFMPSIGSSCVGSFYIFIFLPYNCSPEKWHFPAFKILYSPQFSTYRHRTGFIVKRKKVRITNYIGIPINLHFFFYQFRKFLILSPKNTQISKNSVKKIIHFFFTKR